MARSGRYPVATAKTRVGSGRVRWLRVLLDVRADVNASSKTGATALMWATGDGARVLLLLERGADVNASMRDGTTAFAAATSK